MQAKTLITAMLAGTVILGWASPASGAVLFSDFGPGDTYSSQKYGMDGNLGFLGFRFQVSDTATLDSITVALGRQTSSSNEVQFTLYDFGTNSPGPAIEYFTVPNLSADPGALVTMNSTLHPLLVAGEYYWLAILETTPADGSNAFWYFNNQGVFGRVLTTNFSIDQTMPAFRVNGRILAVPEPGSIALSCLGLVALAARRRARRPA